MCVKSWRSSFVVVCGVLSAKLVRRRRLRELEREAGSSVVVFEREPAEGRKASQRLRGRAASESVAAEEARAAGTQESQRTSREVLYFLSFISFHLGLCVCVCREASSGK